MTFGTLASLQVMIWSLGYHPVAIV